MPSSNHWTKTSSGFGLQTLPSTTILSPTERIEDNHGELPKLPLQALAVTRFERPLPRIGEIERAFATQHEQRLQTSVGENRPWLLIANTAITSAGHRL
jgi:hypothetical protein